MAGDGDEAKKKKKKNAGPKKLHPHMKNLEIVMESLELDTMSKSVMGSRWFVNRDRLIAAKVHAWWQMPLIKLLAILCALAAPVCMFSSTDLPDCAADCEVECQDRCDEQCPEDLYLRFRYWESLSTKSLDEDDKVEDFFVQGLVDDTGQEANYDLYPSKLGQIGNCKCYCECSTLEECSSGELTIAASCLIAITAILMGLDAFFRPDQVIDKQLNAANELTSLGWEFSSLSGDFEGFPSHQEAFETFVHETEIILGRLPPTMLPDDYIETPHDDEKEPKK